MFKKDEVLSVLCKGLSSDDLSLQEFAEENWEKLASEPFFSLDLKPDSAKACLVFYRDDLSRFDRTNMRNREEEYKGSLLLDAWIIEAIRAFCISMDKIENNPDIRTNVIACFKVLEVIIINPGIIEKIDKMVWPTGEVNYNCLCDAINSYAAENHRFVRKHHPKYTKKKSLISVKTLEKHLENFRKILKETIDSNPYSKVDELKGRHIFSNEVIEC